MVALGDRRETRFKGAAVEAFVGRKVSLQKKTIDVDGGMLAEVENISATGRNCLSHGGDDSFLIGAVHGERVVRASHGHHLDGTLGLGQDPDMSVILRSATALDLPSIMSLERSGFAVGIVEASEVFERRLRAFPEGFLLAGAPDPWGYICAELWTSWTLSPENTGRFDLGHSIDQYHDIQGTVLYVASMTVHPGTRGQGRGRLLFSAALTHWKKCFPRVRQVVLIVNETWTEAQRIYRGAGLVVVGRLPQFFQVTGQKPTDALIMEGPVTGEAP